MLYIENICHDPHFNLALEEYVLKNLDTGASCLLLWQNEPSVIIGRFQNTLTEINANYVAEHNIHVVRRISGGGAVYHDLGNLNFTFIERDEKGALNFCRFTDRIIAALARMGVRAESTGRNDITIGGKKFSGNAQFHYRGKTMHHGTLLFNSRLDRLAAALNVKMGKITAKGIKSVHSRVTNIAGHLPHPYTIGEFKQELLNQLLGGKPPDVCQLTLGDLDNIRKLVREKYTAWEWNFGETPLFDFHNSGRFACGGIEVYLRVDHGIIRSCRIYGDFFSSADIRELEQKIQGLPYRREDLKAALTEAELENYFGPLRKEEFTGLVIA